MITISKEVHTVLAQLGAAFGPSHAVYLACGYLRDLFSNQNYGTDITPKDLDFMVVPNEGFEDVDIEPILDSLDWSIFQAGTLVHADYIEDMANRGVERLQMGYSPLAHMEAQLIIYRKHLAPDAVAHDMDINICQVAMDSYGYPYATDAFFAGFDHGFIQVLHDYSAERKAERVNRMLRKYPNFVEVE